MGVKERKEREREQRRTYIMESAKAAFVKYGLDHLTMEKIAEEAELSKGTIYLYYRNRDELLMALVADDMEELCRRMEKVAKGRQSADVRLNKAVRAFLVFAKDNHFFYQALTQVKMGELFNCRDGESDAVLQFRELNGRLRRSLTQVIEDGVEEGTFFLDQPADYVVVQMFVAIKGTIVLINNGMVPPEWIRTSLDQVLIDLVGLFVRGLTCPLPNKKNKQSVKA